MILHEALKLGWRNNELEVLENYALPLDEVLPFSFVPKDNLRAVMDIIDPYHKDFGNSFNKDKLIFSYQVVLRTIDSCLAGKYDNFDGHTTSNCCHGMALLARHLIQEVIALDLNQLRREGEEKLQSIESSKANMQKCNWWIPKSLLNLSCIYILNLIKERDPLKGGRTNRDKLKEIREISNTCCKRLVNDLQKRFANWIAVSYDLYYKQVPKKMKVSGVPVELWGKYVCPSDHIRTNKQGIKCVSNLFSMQIFFAHLIRSRAKVALINDIRDVSGNLKERCVYLFEGDGDAHLKVIPEDKYTALRLFNQSEPIIVLGGCSYSKNLDKEGFDTLIQPWLDKLPRLLLACDVFYPQFVNVSDDPDFNRSPIVPEEESLRKLIDAHSKVSGVSLDDPSFYYAAHIFPASLHQVFKVIRGEEGELPLSYIPSKVLSKS